MLTNSGCNTIYDVLNMLAVSDQCFFLQWRNQNNVICFRLQYRENMLKQQNSSFGYLNTYDNRSRLLVIRF